MYLTSQQAADRIKVSVHTLQYWRSHGGGPPFLRIHERLVRYRSSDLEEWMQSDGVYRSNREAPRPIPKRVVRRERLKE